MTHSQPEGYLTPPEAGQRPGVLVLHAWWGLNGMVIEFCDRLAGEGYTVFAPDLYHGQIASTIPEAEKLGQALDQNHQQARDEIISAADFLRHKAAHTQRGLAVIGFSLGAYYALQLASADPEHVHSVILFYGTGDADFKRSKAAYLGHFAGQDPYEPPGHVDWLENALCQAGRPVVFYRYPGSGHWFFEPDRVDAYTPEAARLAWERTLQFLIENHPT